MSNWILYFVYFIVGINVGFAAGWAMKTWSILDGYFGEIDRYCDRNSCDRLRGVGSCVDGDTIRCE
jgi:hypothetical protein